MNKAIGWLIAGSLLSFGTLEISADTCSCTAPDGSCSASIACSGGCVASCGTGNDCDARCSGGGGGGPSGPLQRPVDLNPAPPAFEELDPGGEPVEPVGGGAEALVNLEFQAATSREVGELLSSQLGLQVAFVNSGPEDLLSLEAVNFPAGELMEWLQRHGSVAFSEPVPVSLAPSGLPAGAASASVLSLHVSDLAVGDLAPLLETVLQTEVRFTPFERTRRVSLDAKSMPVREALVFLSRFGSVAVPELGLEVEGGSTAGSR